MGKRWRDPAHPRPKGLEEYTNVWARGREAKASGVSARLVRVRTRRGWPLSVCYFRATRKAESS